MVRPRRLLSLAAVVATGIVLAGCAHPAAEDGGLHEAPAAVAKATKPAAEKLPAKDAVESGGKGLGGKGLIPLGIGLLAGAAVLAAESETTPSPGGPPGKHQNIGQNEGGQTPGQGGANKDQGGSNKDQAGGGSGGGQTPGTGEKQATGQPGEGQTPPQQGGGTQDQPSPGHAPDGPTPTGQSHAPTAPKPEEDCPQRGRGCVALIIDFVKEQKKFSSEREFEGSYKLPEVKRRLEQINCYVDYVAPRFESIVEGDQAAQKAAIDHNNKEMQRVIGAIESHRDRLKEGAELAIEMINAHGHGSDLADSGGTFGIVTIHDPWTVGIRDPTRKSKRGFAGLSRGLFHSGNYAAAHKHVCGWFAYDSSCFSGLSVRAVDTVNNTGKAEYTLKPVDECKLHAAYDQDLAVSAVGAKLCYDENSNRLTEPLLGPLESFYRSVLLESKSQLGRDPVVEPKSYRPLISGLKKSIVPESGAFYLDGGYKWCTGPHRTGYEFDPAPEPMDW
jgi:hypothetical protein